MHTSEKTSCKSTLSKERKKVFGIGGVASVDPCIKASLGARVYGVSIGKKVDTRTRTQDPQDSKIDLQKVESKRRCKEGLVHRDGR